MLLIITYLIPSCLIYYVMHYSRLIIKSYRKGSFIAKMMECSRHVFGPFTILILSPSDILRKLWQRLYPHAIQKSTTHIWRYFQRTFKIDNGIRYSL